MDTSPRILSVCTSFTKGGAAKAAFRIHRAVNALGTDCTMFVKGKGDAAQKVIGLQGFIPKNPLYGVFDWIRNKCKNQWQHYLWRKYPARSDLFLSDLRSTDIRRALKRINYDILHLHWINLRFIPLDKLPKDKPIVWTLHDSWPFCGICHLPLDCTGYERHCGRCPLLGSVKEKDLSSACWGKKSGLYKKLDLHIVSPSKWLAECAKRSSLFRALEIKVIPNCIDTDSFCPGSRREACERLHLDKDKRHILFGAMNAFADPNKGYDLLLEALRHLNPDSLKNVDLVVFGAKDTVNQDIEFIKTINLGILDNNEDIIAAYRAADVTAVPSRNENLSCTIMESMACATPVTAFNVGGNSDMIEHGKNGYLARRYDAADFAKGLQWCLQNAVTPALGGRARRKIAENFSPDIVGRHYIELYGQLAK